MIFYDYVLITLLSLMTYSDLKTKQIDDWIVGIFWVLSVLAHPEYSTIAIMFFGSLMMLNVFALRIDKKEIFGWADILVIPILFCWISSLTSLYLSGIVLMLCWFATFILARLRKDTIPFIGVLGIGYLLFLIVEFALGGI